MIKDFQKMMKKLGDPIKTRIKMGKGVLPSSEDEEIISPTNESVSVEPQYVSYVNQDGQLIHGQILMGINGEPVFYQH